MGAYKQEQIEEEDRQRRRMHEDDWPLCDRCTDSIDYDMVQFDDKGNIDEFFTPSLCSYCEHMTS